MNGNTGFKAVFLDAATLGDDIDLGPIRRAVAELRLYPGTTPEQLLEHLGDAELILTNKVVIPASVMAGRKAILVLATGTNVVDVAAAEQLGIPVMNVVNYGTQTVAQHTLMLMLALAARLPRYQQAVAAGAWQQSPLFCLMQFPTTQLAGKNLLLVGSGTLGQAVAKLAEAFAMRVQFCARPGATNDSRPSFGSLLPVADVISFHCPLTPQTQQLLNRETLAQVKPGCLVINCARGGVIDELACLAALTQGRLGGLAVDVLPAEPPKDGHPLLAALNESLNLIVTPHNAWISPEARQRIVDLTAENVLRLS
ncbi:D-2-hydroxyacid dehydrogenase [Halioxenophilus sp. WMMB6]|uniref:D-2-hydroxyacid dehydrogenase n=1 Tax=Halioxenophilus sp. WMMB6 TaxID=3073815 RepID=UPI00295F13A5|nr:D-2-hydroxyacid dehydrogenase [Halioxenophilus sp. WMMB6]